MLLNGNLVGVMISFQPCVVSWLFFVRVISRFYEVYTE